VGTTCCCVNFECSVFVFNCSAYRPRLFIMRHEVSHFWSTCYSTEYLGRYTAVDTLLEKIVSNVRIYYEGLS
jgi:hypothetical protein